MRLFFVILFYFISLQHIFSKTTNEYLNYADSLVKDGKFAEMIEFLLPLESSFECETDINRYYYYGLVSGWFIRNHDYSLALSYLEKQARYSKQLKDFLFLSNIYSTNLDFIDRNKAEYYARKALLLDDEASRFSYSKDYSDQHIGRLHYLLGATAAYFGNKVLSKEHLNWINNNKGTVDIDLINHLETLTDSITGINNVIVSDSIRSNSLRIIKESIENKGVSQSSLVRMVKKDESFVEDI
ncbi:MAG: hypothetical protein K2N79_02255, partial [Muribaculaceae bacterium]|nr:hypothetical protein [Muribaculaceae bacterium]